MVQPGSVGARVRGAGQRSSLGRLSVSTHTWEYDRQGFAAINVSVGDENLASGSALLRSSLPY